MNDTSEDIHDAVLDRDIELVRALAAKHKNLELRNSAQETPLISAAKSGQFLITEALLDEGADVWTFDELGLTAGFMAERSRVPDGSIEGYARARVLRKMADRNFPFPAPNGQTVLRLAAQGEWPPSREN